MLLLSVCSRAAARVGGIAFIATSSCRAVDGVYSFSSVERTPKRTHAYATPDTQGEAS
jgi:hypothetical protein